MSNANGLVVNAAGGVVVLAPAAAGTVPDGTTGPDAALRIAVVHRPAYGDWTLPKGKLMAGESHEAAALREVKEETGFTCTLGDPAGRVRYRDRRGRDKVVRYWLMTPEGGGFVPNHEVDKLCWMAVPEAIAALTYPRDRKIVQRLADAGLLRRPRKAASAIRGANRGSTRAEAAAGVALEDDSPA